MTGWLEPLGFDARGYHGRLERAVAGQLRPLVGRRSLTARPGAPVSEYVPVEHAIDQYDQNAEENLELRSQSGRIDER
jgi:hypothetical protein